MNPLFRDPVVPIIQCDPNNPPVVPPVNVPEEVKNLVPQASALVMNQSSMAARNSPARMYCYNVLSNNYWQNNDFVFIVELVVRYCVVKTYKGEARFADQALIQVVKDILTLFTSKLVLTVPELKSVTAPQSVNSAMHNVAAFDDIVREVNSIMNNQHGFHGVGFGGYSGQVMPQNNFNNPMYPNQGFPNNQMVNSNPYQQFQHFNNGSFANNQMVQHHQPIGFGTNRQELSYGGGDNNSLSQDKYFHRQAETNVNRPQQRGLAQSYVAVDEVAVKESTVKTVTVKDRSIMETMSIKFGDEIFDASTVVKGSCGVVYNHEGYIAAESLQSAIVEAKEDIIENNIFGNEDTIYSVSKVLIYRELAALVNIKDCINVLFKPNNFNNFCKNGVTVLYELLENDPSSGDLNRDIQASQSVTFIYRTIVTFVTNQFNRVLSKLGISVDNIFDDGQTIVPYVAKKFGNLVAKEVSDELERLTASFTQFERNIFEEASIDDEVINNKHYGTVYLMVNLAVVNFTDEEFGYAIGNEFITIGDDTPGLNKLVQYLYAGDKNETASPFCYISTIDEVVYEAAKDITTGNFMIKKLGSLI